MNAPANFFLPNRYSSIEPGAQVAGADPYADIRNGNLSLPGAHKQDLMLLMMERYMRADAALSTWSEDAKRCIDFVEGKQWTAEELQKADDEDRPHLTLNKIAPLVRLVLGYHRQNRLDNRFLPTDDAASTAALADVITKIVKQISINNKEPYVDTEIFLDGIMGGRGYYDWRLDFERNDFGEIKGVAKDPFTIRPDPDADQYDPRQWGYVFEGRWWNLDEIEFTFGQRVSQLVSPLVVGGGYRGGVPSDILDTLGEHAPWRTFGGQQFGDFSGIGSVESYISSSVDPYRKNIRVVDCQHYLRVMQRCIVDLETGDREPIPEHFNQQQIQKMMMWAAEQYAMRGAPFPLRVEWRPMKRVRWTTMIGDIVVYDQWSPYESFSIVPFFPYFRRGKTRGMVDDLIDPQREVNKRRSSQIDILTRIAHSGWTWERNSLDEEEKIKIEEHGGAAGLNIEYKGSNPPERIQPGQMPTGIERLEQAATLDLKEIAGINDSALGQVDRVQSGRAIEARQKQSVLGLEMYMDNMKRTKDLCGGKKLELIQNHYTEPRLFMIQGHGGQWNQLGINNRQATGEVINNVMIGRYALAVDETPLSATFMASQAEELATMIKEGIVALPMVQDIAIDLSTLPQKELIKQRQNAYIKSLGFITADEMLQMQAQGIPIDQSMIQQPQEPGGAGGGESKKSGPPEGGNVGPTAAPQLPVAVPQGA
uniref:Putative P22-like portal protein n=1 Tax=viral metagenome TaxID=1070528 RepID=A0A6M3K571_9ZZZZ